MGTNITIDKVLQMVSPNLCLMQQWTITLGYPTNPSKYAWAQILVGEKYKALVRIDNLTKVEKSRGKPFRYQVLGQNSSNEPVLAHLSSGFLELEHSSAIGEKSPPSFILRLKALSKTDPEWREQAFEIVEEYVSSSNRLQMTLDALSKLLNPNQPASSAGPSLIELDEEDSEDERTQNRVRLALSGSSGGSLPEKRQTIVLPPELAPDPLSRPPSKETTGGSSGGRGVRGPKSKRGRGNSQQGRGLLLGRESSLSSREAGTEENSDILLGARDPRTALLKRRREPAGQSGRDLTNVDEEDFNDLEEDDAAKTPAEEFKITSQSGRRKRTDNILRNYCPLGLEILIIDIDQIVKPYRGDDVKMLPSHQIRLISKSFLKGLTEKFRSDYNAITADNSILLVDPEQCPTKEDFDYSSKDKYRFFALGGNHSLCARADLSAEDPTSYDMRNVKAQVVAGLPLEDQRFLAWSDNVDAEYRNKMSHIHRIVYIHNRWVEMDKPDKNFEFKRQMAEEVHFDNWGTKSAKNILNTHDNHFQLAFRVGKVWNQVLRVFQQWEAGKIKDQKFDTPQPRKRAKGEKVVDNADRGVTDMKLTHWVSMQGVANEDSICAILGRVISGEYSLAQMDHQFNLWKWNDKIRKAFCAELGLPTFKRCQEEYPDLNDEKKWSYEREFEKQAELIKNRRKENPDAKKKRPKKGISAEQERDLEREKYPSVFITYCTFLKNSRAQAANQGGIRQDLHQFAFEHPVFGSLFYEVFTGDARQLQSIEGIKARPYTLMIADIPYGFKLASANHNDDLRWEKADILQMVQSFKLLTTASFFRIVLMHCQRQTQSVIEVLDEECNCGSPMDGVWFKPNAYNDGGARLNHQTEYFFVGLGSADANKGKSFDFFNFAHDEDRSNLVTAKTVTKYKAPLTGKIINGYQKPRKLYNYFVCHYSKPKDWILDLCAGSGTGSLCALGCGRNATAVEIDPGQASQIPARLHAVKDDLHGTLEDPTAADVAKELRTSFTSTKVAAPFIFDVEGDGENIDVSNADADTEIGDKGEIDRPVHAVEEVFGKDSPLILNEDWHTVLPLASGTEDEAISDSLKYVSENIVDDTGSGECAPSA